MPVHPVADAQLTPAFPRNSGVGKCGERRRRRSTITRAADEATDESSISCDRPSGGPVDMDRDGRTVAAFGLFFDAEISEGG